MAVYNKFNCFVEDVMEGKHNFASNTIKAALTNTLPTSSLTTFSQITEITSGSGYAQGGIAITITSSSATGGVYKLVLQDTTFTAGGAVGPFRYIVLYNSTETTKPLICWFDYGSSLSLNSGETFLLNFDDVNGLLTLS